MASLGTENSTREGYCLLFALALADLDKRVIEQEVDDADIENAVVIIPTLANVMTHDDLRERIAGQREGLILGDRLFLCSQCVGRLNVGLLAAGGCNEVNFPRNRSDLSFDIFLITIDDADVTGASTDNQLKKDYDDEFARSSLIFGVISALRFRFPPHSPLSTS